MQATSSQVATTSVSAPSYFYSDEAEVEPGATILPALQREAKAAGRDHLLVGRRRRNNRRGAH